MFNGDINRQDVTDYFMNLVKSDPRLTKYQNDLGIIALSNELGFKVDEAVKRISNSFTEFYDPNSETVLLAKLMYEIGYLKFQKPLIVNAKIKSNNDIVIEKNQRFTDGINIYLLNESVSLVHGIEQTIELTRGTIRTINTVVENDVMYHKVNLGTTYRRIYGISAKRGNDELEYSQAFITESSDVSMEVDIFGNLIMVIRTNNVHGKNVLLGDTISIDLMETEPTDTVPTSMAIIGIADVICTEITKAENYETYLSIQEMQRILKFNKNINNSLVYNEDYKSFIRANVRGIDLIKVWQQEDEDRENGSLACNINKVFCSYIPVEEGSDLNDEIYNKVSNAVYGKYIIFREPSIFPITVEISIVNNSKKSIPLVKQNEIKQKISGYYDDVEKRLTKANIYKVIVETLKDNDIDVDIRMSDKSNFFENAIFYHIAIDDINIDINERDA